jgi:hypothetical protein
LSCSSGISHINTTKLLEKWTVDTVEDVTNICNNKEDNSKEGKIKFYELYYNEQ